MDTISPNKIRYIKLGKGGSWEGALERGTLEWGSENDAHVSALVGQWDAIAKQYRAADYVSSTATGYTNEARAFFDDDPAVMWITFARGRMWWCFARALVKRIDVSGELQGLYVRQTLDGWHDHDREGNALTLDRLSTRLSRLTGYQRTICNLSKEQHELCLRYINAADDDAQVAVASARAELRRHLTVVLQRLSPGDFEQFVDLALARTGWTRVSSLGGTLKDIDLVVEQPFTRERIAVQVKSSATQQVVEDYARRLREHKDAKRSLLICHSPIGTLSAPPNSDGYRFELLLGEAVTDLAIDAGLLAWVVERGR
jgi:hypothetical protein